MVPVASRHLPVALHRIGAVRAPQRGTAMGRLQHGDLAFVQAVQRLGRRVAEAVAGLDVESVAVCLLHSYRFPENEQRIGEAIRQRCGEDLHVSLSHDVVGTFREFERAATTEIDAALSPLLAGYLERLARRSDEEGLPRPEIMQSSGGVAGLEEVADHATLAILSGPAGGAAAASLIAEQSGEKNLLALSDFSSDMGQLRRAFELFEQKTQLMRLLDVSSQADGVRIFIGGESQVVPFEELSVVSAPYEVDGQVVGTLGVIGPTRMPYDRMIQIVDITSKLVSNALSHHK